MKIYLLWSGAYSNMDVEAVFSTKEKAEQALSFFKNKVSYLRIEEIELDPEDTLKEPDGKVYFQVIINYNGNIEDIFDISDSSEIKNEFIDWPESNMIRCQVWANDEAHAAKICNEYRASFLAEKALLGKEDMKNNENI